MANESKASFKGKVTLGATTVLGMGTHSWSGYSRELLEDVEFGDDVDDFLYGILRAGKISFSGNYKKDDTTGQDALRSAMRNAGEITDIRFYVDSVSYYTPNSTTAAGGGLPAESKVSHVKVESCDGPDLSLGALGKISFTVQVCGYMRLI